MFDTGPLVFPAATPKGIKKTKGMEKTDQGNKKDNRL